MPGFDQITGGGIPEGRVTAITGGTGAGKTVFALQILVNRLNTDGETGAFVAFEEPVAQVQRNIASFDWRPSDHGHVRIHFIDAKTPTDMIVSGEFDLIGMLEGVGALIERTGARIVVFDGIDRILTGLPGEAQEHRELTRLDDWIRKSGVTGLITLKPTNVTGRNASRFAFMQYITDCVVRLDRSFTDTTSSRSLVIVKYRGSGFAMSPYPLVIDRSGADVVLFSDSRVQPRTFTDRLTTGIARLDTLLGGGYLRGSSTLITGSPGTSKTRLAASFVAAACERGEQSLFVSFDEAASQIVANMRSIGLDLQKHIDSGHLRIASMVSGASSPEEHFHALHRLLDAVPTTCIVIDPLSALTRHSYPFTALILDNVVVYAKARGLTVLVTSLLDHGELGGEKELSAAKVSTVADTWMHVSYIINNGERNRALTIIKSRGTQHSNQVRELSITESGLELKDVYLAEGQVLLGTARIQKENADRRERILKELTRKRDRTQRDIDLHTLQDRVAATTQELEWKRQEAEFAEATERTRSDSERIDLQHMRDARGADGAIAADPVPARRKRGRP